MWTKDDRKVVCIVVAAFIALYTLDFTLCDVVADRYRRPMNSAVYEQFVYTACACIVASLHQIAICVQAKSMDGIHQMLIVTTSYVVLWCVKFIDLARRVKLRVPYMLTYHACLQLCEASVSH